MKPEICEHDCPGCGMTFSPDVHVCPLEVFDGWEVGVELEPWEIDVLTRRKEKGADYEI